MAQGLMGLQDLLGQSSNAQQQSGLLGGGVFSQPESRGRRRSRLLNDAIAGAAQNPYGQMGAAIGGLLGMAGRSGAEALGIADKPPEVQRAEAIRQVQQEAADQGLNVANDPRGFGDFVAGRFQELGQPQLATRSLLQARQIESQLAPEEKEGVLRVVGGTEQAQQAAQLYPGLGIDSLGEGESATISLTGNRATGIEVDSPSPPNTQKVDIIDPNTGEPAAGSFNPKTGEYTIGDRVIENPRPVARETNLQKVNIIDPESGSPVVANYNRRTGETTLGNRVVENPQPAPSRIQEGGPEDFQLKQTQEFDTRTVRANVRNYIETAEDAVEMLEESPDINTWVGSSARLINDLQAEVEAGARAAGVEFDEELLDPTKYGDTFDELGIKNAQMRGLVTSLGFQAAAAAGQEGRAVTERDLQRFIKEVGASASDPRAFAETLRDSVDRNVRSLRILSQELEAEPLGGDFTFRGEPIGLTREEREQMEGSGQNERLRYNPETGRLE